MVRKELVLHQEAKRWDKNVVGKEEEMPNTQQELNLRPHESRLNAVLFPRLLDVYNKLFSVGLCSRRSHLIFESLLLLLLLLMAII